MPLYDLRAAFRSVNYGNPLAGTIIVNTVHFQLAALTSGQDPNTLANEIYSRFGTAYRGVLGDNDKLLDLTVTYEPTSTEYPSQGVKNVNANGTRSIGDAILSAGLCQLLTLKTDTPKRYARGRLFLPPAYVDAAADANGTWKTSNAYWTTATTLAALMIASWTTGDNTYTPVIYSQRQRALGESDPSYPITSYVQQPAQHFLRSRTNAP